MPKYMFKGSFSREGLAGVMKEGGTSRVAAVEKLVASVGGKLHSYDFAFGSSDFYIVADLPDHVAVLTIVRTTTASGALSKLETVVLVPPSDVDLAGTRVADYRPPGS